MPIYPLGNTPSQVFLIKHFYRKTEDLQLRLRIALQSTTSSALECAYLRKLTFCLICIIRRDLADTLVASMPRTQCLLSTSTLKRFQLSLS